MHFKETDVLIIGAGIMGLTIARELVRKGIQRIVIIEKEAGLGRHASGRNSGVLHAGIYYSPDSLKARSCLAGNFLMKEYCRKKNLPMIETGKVIVARCESELPTLHELYTRAVSNGAKVDMVSEKDLSAIEPNAFTVKEALYSHYTAVVDPKLILEQLRRDLEQTGKVSFLFNAKFEDLRGSHTAVTSRDDIKAEYFINSAGAHCETVSRAFGIGRHYRLIPFKGVYRKLTPEAAKAIKGSIYPVPDIRNPFLGVHFTRNVHGDVYLGPTAIPAFGRENYGIFQGIGGEGLRILADDADLFFTNPKFREVALVEPRKYFFPFFFKDAARLVKTLDPDHVHPTGKVGIRPQLVDWRSRELVMDFRVESTDESLHVLNPISPAFTCSMHLARQIVDTYF